MIEKHIRKDQLEFLLEKLAEHFKNSGVKGLVQTNRCLEELLILWIVIGAILPFFTNYLMKSKGFLYGFIIYVGLIITLVVA